MPKIFGYHGTATSGSWRDLAEAVGGMQQLADAVGVSYPTIYRWAVKGDTVSGPAKRVIADLSAAHGVENPAQEKGDGGMNEAGAIGRGVTMTTDVDPEWVRIVTGGAEGCADIFERVRVGYWAYGALHDPALGWLVYEQADDPRPGEEEVAVAAAAWRAGKALPERWHRFDVQAAVAAWIAGVKRFGERWFQDGDGPRCDYVMQIGLGCTWVHEGKVHSRYG